ncbi:retrovirus-related pol polyprotein from transposon TNT 1-94 [Tanacetum coccineum]
MYKLKKALYGLKQAPHKCYDMLSSFLISQHFSKGVVDPTLFTWKAGNDLLLVQIYVDDIIFASTNTALCNEFPNLMTTKFKMLMMGQMAFFLGLQISQSPRGIFLNQSKYASKIIKNYGLLTSDSIDTPMVKKNKLDEDLQGTPVDAKLYRGMIGSLMYLTSSRPDLIYFVCLCAWYQAKPIENYLNAVKRIFQYLNGTINMGLWYSKDTGMSLTAYSDADQRGVRTLDAVHPKVLNYYVINLLAGLPRSKRALRSRLQRLSILPYLGVMLKSYGCEQVENGIAELYFVRTEYQLADIFTKPLPRERFNFLVKKLGMRRKWVGLENCDSKNINPVATQQVALDNSMVAPEKRLKIKKCNAISSHLGCSQICPRLHNQDFVEPPSEEALVTFIHDLGYPGKCISGKTIGLDRLRESRDIKDSKAYKTYYDFATGKATLEKERKYKKVASPSRKLSPVLEEEPTVKPKKAKKPAKKSTTIPTTGVVIRDTPSVSVSKKKAPAKFDRGKGIDLLFDAALHEAAQVKDAACFKKSTKESSFRFIQGKVRSRWIVRGALVLCIGCYHCESYLDIAIIGQGDSKDDDNDDDSNDVSKGDDDKPDNDDDDGNDAQDSERTDLDEEENPNLNLKVDEEKETQEDEEFDAEEYDDLYMDVDVKSLGVEREKEGKGDAEMTDVDQDVS